MMQIWQQVKAANPGLSVCEIGATIGKMWRELTDEQKQRFNEDFSRAKVTFSFHRKTCKVTKIPDRILT